MQVRHELWTRLLLSALAGGISWSGPLLLIPVSLALPILCRKRFAVAFAYFAAALWPAFPSGVALYGWNVIPFLLAALIAVGCFLAFPWAFLPSPIAFLVTALPPFGIIGVAHPITAAGVLFPDTAWFGLALTAVLPTLLVRFPAPAVALALSLSLVTNAAHKQPRSPAGWEGINTHLGNIGTDAASEFRAAELIQATALNSSARVLVFPEMVVTRWTEATEAFWQPILEALARDNRAIVIGAGLPIQQTRNFRNALVVAGGERKHFLQRIPLPWVMWNPLATNDRVPLNIRGTGILTLAGERAAALICYEQLVPWPILSAVAEHPTLILSVSNATWTEGTPIPVVQAANVTAWSRLFGLPIVASLNQ